MQLTGTHRISAPRQKVWEALHDAGLLKECIKGCQKLDKVGERKMVATVVAKIGPVKATFDADVEIVDPVAPERYTLRGEGKGGVAGFARGEARVQLAEDGRDTILSYQTDATVGGKLAQLGSRLVDTTAKKYAADFFAAFSHKVGAGPEGGVPPHPVGTLEGEAGGRIEPSRAEEGIYEIEEAVPGSPVAPPHAEDTLAEEVVDAAAARIWGGPWFWGALAFLVVLVLLFALS